MQKKLLGMAVATALAAPAAAFAQVQVYGTANVTFNSTKYSASTAGVPSVSKMSVNSHSSNFGIRSSETLGGGMTGWVQFEFNTQMERNNDLNAGNGTPRNTAVGLRGNFGNVYFGTWETPYTSTFRLWDVGTIGGYGPTTSVAYRRESTASGPSSNCGGSNPGGNGGTFSVPTTICNHADGAGPSGSGGYALWRRYGSAVHYDSPTFSGFAFRVSYQPNETKSVAHSSLATLGSSGTAVVTENPSSWSASLTWNGMGGKARAFLATMQAKDWTAIGQTDGGYNLGGGYDFGVANVGVYYETYDFKTATVKTTVQEMALGVAIPLGSGKIGFSYAVAKDPKVSSGAVPDSGAKMWNLGYEWALSKRTAVSFGYAAIENDTAAAFTWTGMAPNQTGYDVRTLPGSDPSNLFFGLRHSF